MAYTIAYFDGMLDDLTKEQLTQLLISHIGKAITQRSIRNWRKSNNLPVDN